MTKSRKTLLADGLALVVYAVAANPALTGIPFHEWAGLAMLLVLFVHCCANVGWAAGALKTGNRRNAVNLIMGLLLLVALIVTVVSGLMVSGTVLPLFGLYAPGYFFWDPLHAAAVEIF